LMNMRRLGSDFSNEYVLANEIDGL